MEATHAQKWRFSQKVVSDWRGEIGCFKTWGQILYANEYKVLNKNNKHTHRYPPHPTHPQKIQYQILKGMEIHPQIQHPPPNNTATPPLPPTYYHVHPLKYQPQQCIYTDGSFIPPSKNSEGQIVGNTVGSGVYSPNNNTQISERLPGYQNILRAELNAILIAIKTIQTTQRDIHIFTDSLNSIYLLNNHIQHPTSQHHHPDKLLITAIIHQIY